MRETVTADALMSRHTSAWQAATVHPFLAGVRDGSLPEHSFDRIRLARTATSRSPAIAAVTYSGYPAQITAIWALERSYLESWDSARAGAHAYREFVNGWTTDGFRSYVGDLQVRSPARGLHRRTGPRS